MTSGAGAPPRANYHGHPCPPWCRTDHNELLIPGKRVFGHMDTHYSDPISKPPGAPRSVTLALDPRTGKTMVSLALAPAGAVRLALSPEQADALARVIELDRDVSSGLRLGAELRAAARSIAPGQVTT